MYKFTTEQTLNVSLQQAWRFFTSPANLAKITPPDMDFEVLTSLNDKVIYPGMEIDYIVKPLAGIPLKWRTLITNVDAMHSFTDRQIKGPYAHWEHTHTFKEIEPGRIHMTDEVKYQLPYGPIGHFVHRLFVRQRIVEIFNYRRRALEIIFHTDGKLDD